MDFSLLLCLFLCFASCVGKNNSTNASKPKDDELQNVRDQRRPFHLLLLEQLFSTPALIVDFQRLDWNATAIGTTLTPPRVLHRGRKTNSKYETKKAVDHNNRRRDHVLSKATSSEKIFWAIARRIEVFYGHATFVGITLFVGLLALTIVLLVALWFALRMGYNDRLLVRHQSILVQLILLYTCATLFISLEVIDIMLNLPLNIGLVFFQSCLIILFPRKILSTYVRLLIPRIGFFLSTAIDVSFASIIICQPIMEFANIYRKVLETFILSRD